MCELCRDREGTVLVVREGGTFLACIECAAASGDPILRNPVAAYSAVVWTVALGLVTAAHPRAVGVAAWVLLAVLSGRAVSLAQEYREARLWYLPAAVAR
jgi:hypothetical protein